MTQSGLFASAGRSRAASDAGLAVFVLILPLAAILRPALDLGLIHAGIPEPQSRWPVLAIGLVYAGLFSTLLGALRLRRGVGGSGQRLQHELAGAVAVISAIWVGALLAHFTGALWVAAGPSGRQEELAFVLRSPLLAVTSAGEAALAYPLCRGAVLAWPIWDRLRRTRLLWALTHAQLVGSLVLVVAVATLSTATIGVHRFGPPFGPEVLPNDAGPAAVLLAWITTRFLPGLTGLLVLGVVASAFLLPPAIMISFLALRRTTRRLEELATATGALRAGDLATRVRVAGEDEVGRLQVDLNAMAADLERTLRDLQAERDRVAGLLEARRQLVASVSHELRTPLATVRGYIESALSRDQATALGASSDSGQLGQALRADLETMEREVSRLERLIEDLFALSRAEVGKLDLRLEPTDVGAVVRRLVDTMAPLGWQQRRVQVLAEVAPNLPPARADAERLEQVISNLLGNAVRHTPPGGLVAASVDVEPDAIQVRVRDTGEGITPDALPHIFERFYHGPRVDGERRDGAGLGLALAKELTEAMGGSVAVASTPSEGSCFTVRLPRA